MVKKLQGQALTDVGHVREDHHRARFRDVDEPDHVLAAAELEDRSVRDRRVAQLLHVRRSAAFSARDHSAIENEAGRHSTCLPIYGDSHLSQPRLRIGLRQSVTADGPRLLPARHWRARCGAVYELVRDVGYSFKMNGLGLPMSDACEVDDASQQWLRLAAGPAGAQVAPALRRRSPDGLRRLKPKPSPQAPAAPTRDARSAGPGQSRLRPGQPSRRPPPPVPVPLPPPSGTCVSAQDLLIYIQQVGKDGLNPADYDPAGLAAAIQARRSDCCMSQAATDRLRSPVVGPCARATSRSRRGSTGASSTTTSMPPSRMRCCAPRLPSTTSRSALNGLLPTHPQYAALKAALEVTPTSDTAKINRIRLNMDRWRWLPRDLGQKYIIVNVPELLRDARRERRQPLEAARGRRQAFDSDAAAVGDWRSA